VRPTCIVVYCVIATPAVSGTREALFTFLYLQEVAAWDKLPSISAVKLHRLVLAFFALVFILLALGQPYASTLPIHVVYLFTRKPKCTTIVDDDHDKKSFLWFWPCGNPLCNARFGASARSQTFVSTFLILDRNPFINTSLGGVRCLPVLEACTTLSVKQLGITLSVLVGSVLALLATSRFQPGGVLTRCELSKTAGSL
jgi:hypothetical protein